MGIKPCKTTSWWLDASLPLRYFTDFAASAKSWAELLHFLSKFLKVMWKTNSFYGKIEILKNGAWIGQLNVTKN